MLKELSILATSGTVGILSESTKFVNSHLQRRTDLKIHNNNMLMQSNMLRASVAMACVAEGVKLSGAYLQYKNMSNQVEKQHQMQMAKITHDTESMNVHYDMQIRHLEAHSKAFELVMQNIDNNSIDEQLNALSKQSSEVIAKIIAAQCDKEREFFMQLHDKICEKQKELSAISAQNSNNAIVAFKELAGTMMMNKNNFCVDNRQSNDNIIEGEWQ